MKENVYIDKTNGTPCLGIFISDVNLISAGTTVYSMSLKYKTDYQKYSDLYDLNFIFDDNIPDIDFYTVPQTDIFAIDRNGGFFATIGEETDIDVEAQICYINKNKECFVIAKHLKSFIENIAFFDLKKSLEPTNKVVFYESKEDAEKNGLEFFEYS